MKIEWLSIDDFQKRCRKVYRLISKQLIDRNKPKQNIEEGDNFKLLKKLEAYDTYFRQQVAKKQLDIKTSNPDTLRTQAQLRTASVTNMPQSRSSSSLAPTINLNRQRSISMISEYDLFTSTNNSPKTKMNKQFAGMKDFIIKPQQNHISSEEQKEYFPMPFEVNKRLVSSGSQDIQNRLRRQQEREKGKNQKLLNKLLIRPQSNIGNGMKQSLNQISIQEDLLDQKLQEVSFMSQENLEKLVFKQYDNIKNYGTHSQHQYLIDNSHKHNSNLMRKYRKQKTLNPPDNLKLQQQFNQDQYPHNQSMEVLDEQIKAYQDDKIHFEKDDHHSEISASQIEEDDLGLPRVKPLYLDKENDVTMDRILGIKQGEVMNDKEREVIDKINRFEKEYMIEKVLEKMENGQDDEVDDKDSPVNTEDEIQKRNQEFIMQNFFKVYDREPNTRSVQTPINSKKLEQKPQQLILVDKLSADKETKKATQQIKSRAQSHAVSTANKQNNNYYSFHKQQQQNHQSSFNSQLNQQHHSTNQSQNQQQPKRPSLTLKSNKSGNTQQNDQLSDYDTSDDDSQDNTNQTYKKRLRLNEVFEVQQFISDRNSGISCDYRKINTYLKRLSFFAKYPYQIRQQLLQECELREVKSGDRLFQQGDSSMEFYVILRGSTKAILIKKDYGNIPIVINTFYDGKEFGEVNLYEESETLSAEMVKQLNKQKYTCEAMEDSYIIILEKEKTNKIINANLQANFEKRIEFLKQIDIFKGLEMHVLLPLANNLITEHYRLGEYILKEGQQPKGLYLLYKGQCKVGSEKLNMRSKSPFQFGNKLKRQMRNFKFKGNFHDLEHKLNFDTNTGNNGKGERVDTRETNNHEPIHIAKANGDGTRKAMFNEKRVFQNDRVYFDENGKKIKDHIVYKDYMVFFTLTMKDYFGGRVLLVGDNTTNHKNYYFDTKEGDLIEDEEAAAANNSQSMLQLKNEPNSSLSVIADSSEVELLIMDRTQLSFFQEKIQKEIYHRIEKAFQPDQPYEGAVVEKIKDKFREWEKYKLETVNSILKQSYAERKKASILNINR